MYECMCTYICLHICMQYLCIYVYVCMYVRTCVLIYHVCGGWYEYRWLPRAESPSADQICHAKGAYIPYTESNHENEPQPANCECVCALTTDLEKGHSSGTSDRARSGALSTTTYITRERFSNTSSTQDTKQDRGGTTLPPG